MIQTKIINLIILLLVGGAVHAQSVTGNGTVTKENRTIEAFNAIETSHGWDLILTQGSEHKMVVEADANLHEYLITEVNKQGSLKISMKPGINIKGSKKRVIHLTFVELGAIAASGGSDIYAEQNISAEKFALALSGGSDLKLSGLEVRKFSGAFSGGSDADIDFVNYNIDDMSLQASGGSDLRMRGVNVENLSMQTSGGSDTKISGTAKTASIDASGGSDLSADDLIISECALNMGGSSDAKIHVTEKLSANLGGGSDVACQGNPKYVSKQVCKSCDLSL